MQRSKRLHRSNSLPLSRRVEGPRGSATGRNTPRPGRKPQRLPRVLGDPDRVWRTFPKPRAPSVDGRSDLGALQHQSRPRLGPVHSQYTKRPLTALNHRCPQRRSLEQYQRFTRLSTITSDPDKDLLIRRSSVRARRGPPRVCAGHRLRICFHSPTEPSLRRPMWHILCHMVRDKQSVHFQSEGHRFSRPVAQGGVCAGHRLRPGVVIWQNRA